MWCGAVASQSQGWGGGDKRAGIAGIQWPDPSAALVSAWTVRMPTLGKEGEGLEYS